MGLAVFSNPKEATRYVLDMRASVSIVVPTAQHVRVALYYGQPQVITQLLHGPALGGEMTGPLRTFLKHGTDYRTKKYPWGVKSPKKSVKKTK